MKLGLSTATNSKVEALNCESPEQAREKVFLDNLTPLKIQRQVRVATRLQRLMTGAMSSSQRPCALRSNSTTSRTAPLPPFKIVT